VDLLALADTREAISCGAKGVDAMTYETAADALAAWDGGEIVTTVELGGLKFVAVDDNIDAFSTLTDLTVHRIDQQCGGFSGAQVGAARWLAFTTLRDGWDVVIEKARKKDQTTMVSRAWPNVPTPVSA
jgi:hypothetical protein